MGEGENCPLPARSVVRPGGAREQAGSSWAFGLTWAGDERRGAVSDLQNRRVLRIILVVCARDGRERSSARRLGGGNHLGGNDIATQQTHASTSRRESSGRNRGSNPLRKDSLTTDGASGGSALDSRTDGQSASTDCGSQLVEPPSPPSLASLGDKAHVEGGPQVIVAEAFRKT